MIASNFHTDGNDAVSRADDGRGKLAQPAQAMSSGPVYRAQQSANGEQLLVDHLEANLGAFFPRTLLVAYYVSLKTNPFVVLTGPEGAGKAAMAAGFAAALVGRESGQIITIGSDSWARRGSQSSYYRDIHKRFGAVQLGDTLNEAAAPENSGKLFLVLLKGLTADELDLYTNRLLQVAPNGQLRLALPGVALAAQPVIPPNCFVTATVHAPGGTAPFDQDVLRHAGQIEFSLERETVTEAPLLPLPPVGLQRIMLGARALHGQAARLRLNTILGRSWLRRLGPSPTVAAGLLEGGIALTPAMRDEIMAYVANSYDSSGRGLFDADDPRRNAQYAYDAQVVQRLLWRIDWRRRALHRRLSAHLYT